MPTSSTNKPKKSLILNAFISGSPSSIWQSENDTSREFSRSLDYWISAAQLAERGKLNSIFLADHLTLFDDYDSDGTHGNYRWPLEKAIYAPRVDPGVLLSALAQKTETIGFGITFSTVSEHPYHFARRLATVDHFTKGRVGWNIVASYLNSIGRQLLNGEAFPEHDERYVKTGEYLDVVYDLLLSSWRDDAVKYDKKDGIFADPDQVREINHVGKYYNVPGPSVTEPSAQRFPLVIQAGTSTKGKLFAAENAEIVFVGNGPTLKDDIKEIRTLAAEKFGRNPNHIKFISSICPVLGKTHEEALEKLQQLENDYDEKGQEVAFSAITGIDLSKYQDDDIIPYKKSNNLSTTVEKIYNKNDGSREKGKTKRQILDSYKRFGKYVGTGEEVANQIEKLVNETGLDGFNLGILVNFPRDLEDIVDLLVPALQKKGLFWEDYAVPGGTFRENAYGVKGQTFFPKDHPAYKLRWTPDYTKEQFEKHIKASKKIIHDSRN